MVVNTQSESAFAQREIEMQMDMIEKLILALRRDYEKHKHETSVFACSPVGNKGQMQKSKHMQMDTMMLLKDFVNALKKDH